MARIDIEIEDYLDEVDTPVLIDELLKRADFKMTKDHLSQIDSDILLDELTDRIDTLELIKKILHLKQWYDKKSIIQEIEDL
jgi:hypothetical protein